MKRRIHAKSPVALALLVFCAQIAPVPGGQTASPAPGTQQAPVQLSAHAWDVLRLVRGDISDEIIITYINRSGKDYALGASEILYLREQGVSDQVLAAMITQGPNIATPAPQGSQQPTPPRPTGRVDDRYQHAILPCWRASPCQLC